MEFLRFWILIILTSENREQTRNAEVARHKARKHKRYKRYCKTLKNITTRRLSSQVGRTWPPCCDHTIIMAKTWSWSCHDDGIWPCFLAWSPWFIAWWLWNTMLMPWQHDCHVWLSWLSIRAGHINFTDKFCTFHQWEKVPQIFSFFTEIKRSLKANPASFQYSSLGLWALSAKTPENFHPALLVSHPELNFHPWGLSSELQPWVSRCRLVILVKRDWTREQHDAQRVVSKLKYSSAWTSFYRISNH